jgi:hypothetical protein
MPSPLSDQLLLCAAVGARHGILNRDPNPGRRFEPQCAGSLQPFDGDLNSMVPEPSPPFFSHKVSGGLNGLLNRQDKKRRGAIPFRVE